MPENLIELLANPTKSRPRKLCLMACFFDIWGALLNLATRILRSELPADKADLPPNFLNGNTVIQLAVTALKY